MKTIIVALGGNALARSGRRATAREMLKNLKRPLNQVARLSRKNRIVITHGNGPQVGNLLLQQQACRQVPEMPLEILVAQTQGWIGYMIEETLDNELMKMGITHPLISTVLTYVRVNESDPAFQKPSKPIGPVYKRKRKGFMKTPEGWRRCVASPLPLSIVEWREIKKLISNRFIVIACGGGGIPVTREHRRYEGIEAVIDKDLASAKLGQQVGADLLIVATRVEKVALHYGKSNQKNLDELSLSHAKKYLKENQFAPGSMAPKIQAAVNFLEAGKKLVVITSMNKIEAAIEGRAGTKVYA